MRNAIAGNIHTLDTVSREENFHIGRIHHIETDGTVYVIMDSHPQQPVKARLTAAFQKQCARTDRLEGLPVLLCHDAGDMDVPIIIDRICDRLEASEPPPLCLPEADDVLVDGKKVVFEAREQIELRCGDARITLTKAGKILIRGNYVLSRSSGANRIKGGSIQLN